MKVYNKLVRDRIPYIIKKSGAGCKFHIAKDDAEFEAKLFEKLQEEIGEFKETHTPEEFADIMEVMEAISTYFQINLGDVKKAKKEKKLERGSFRDKVILETTT